MTFSSFGDFEIIYKKAQDLCQKSPSILSDSDENESFDDTDILAMEKPKKKLKIEDSILEDFGLEQKSFEKETTNTFEFAIRTEIQIYPKKANEAKFDYLQFFELKERKKSVEHEIKEEEKKPEKMKEKEEIPLKKEEEEEKKEIIKIEIKNEVENEIKSPFSFKQNVNMPDQSKHYPYQHVSFMNNQNNNTSFQQLNNYNIINNYNNGFLTHQQQIFPQQQNFNYMSNLSTIPFNQQNIFYQQQNNLNINRQGNHVFFLNLKKQ